MNGKYLNKMFLGYISRRKLDVYLALGGALYEVLHAIKKCSMQEKSESCMPRKTQVKFKYY